MWPALKRYFTYAALGGLSVFIGTGLLALLPMSPGALLAAFILFFPALFGGPIFVLILAVKRGGGSRVLGALSAIPLLLVALQIPKWLQVWQVSNLNQREFLPHSPQQVLLLAANEGRAGCNDLCLGIMLSTGLQVGVKARAEGVWKLYELTSGKVCPGAEVQQYLRLLSKRYVDVCISSAAVPSPQNAILIRDDEDLDSDMHGRVPWRGTGYEFIERINGEERLLGRWASPGLSGDDWFYDPLGYSNTGSVARFDPLEFYSRALNTTLEWTPPSGPASTAEVIEALRPYFANADTIHPALEVFAAIVESAPPQETGLLYAFMKERALELEANAAANRRGLERINGWLRELERRPN